VRAESFPTPATGPWRGASLLLALAFGTGCASGPGREAKVVEEFVTRTGFNGVVLVAAHGAVLDLETRGFESFEDRRPTTPATRYQLGSISKWITTLLVLRLVDEGQLSLEAPIGRYLPGITIPAGDRVTLHHLLSHTSGVPNDIIAAYQADPSVLERPLSTPDAIRAYAGGVLAFEPGSRFDYSHSNWILVKGILESVTGHPFAEDVRRLLTGPLHLEDTGVFSGDGSTVPHLARAYDCGEGEPRPVTAAFPDYLACAGGIYSTATDLFALLEALYGGELLSADSLRRLDTVWVEDEGYAYGGRVRSLELAGRPERVLWHSGSNGPSKSRVSRVLSDGTTVLTLSNTGAPPEETGALTERVLAALHGPEGDAAPRPD